MKGGQFVLAQVETPFAKNSTIPARPSVGLSAANEAEMEETAAVFLARYVR